MNNETNLLLSFIFLAIPIFLLPEKYGLIGLTIGIPLAVIFSSFLDTVGKTNK